MNATQNPMRFHVYEKLSAAQIRRIWNSSVVETIDEKPCRKVAMGITPSMLPMFQGPRYIVRKVKQ